MKYLSMLENYINDKAIMQKIIAIRCKYAESVYKFESTDQMAHHSDRKYTLSTEQKFFIPFKKGMGTFELWKEEESESGGKKPFDVVVYCIEGTKKTR